MAKYDIAISFAGEQRAFADSIARRLDAAGYSVFYDRFAIADLWGADLPVKLSSIYADEARFCLVIVSKEYVEKAWPNLERQNAIARFMRDHKGYLLCVQVDDCELPGLPRTVGYLDLRVCDIDTVYNAILQKIGAPDHGDQESRFSETDRRYAKRILEACYTRAVFTRMDGEIDVNAMYHSIRVTIGKLQKIVPKIKDQSLQNDGLMIVNLLDQIDRTSLAHDPARNLWLSRAELESINELKREVVSILLHIRRSAVIAMQMLSELTSEYFFDVKAASAPPMRWW
jgi:Uncharacterized protein containing a TIR (Toll-Interleukin 1-resistance) domain